MLTTAKNGDSTINITAKKCSAPVTEIGSNIVDTTACEGSILTSVDWMTTQLGCSIKMMPLIVRKS